MPPGSRRRSLTEGAVATGLIVSGGKQALQGLQAASICSGLPYTFFLCIMCTSLWRGLRQHADPRPVRRWQFALLDGVFDAVDWAVSVGGRPFPRARVWGDFVVALVCPGWPLGRVVRRLNATRTLCGSVAAWNCGVVAAAHVLFYGFVALYCAWAAVPGLYALAWLCYAAFACVLAMLRHRVRTARGINGNVLEDLFASALLYPQVVCQLQRERCREPGDGR